jgi:hypothetical protein
MTPTPPIASAALQILQQSNLAAERARQTSPMSAPDAILAAANGVPVSGSDAQVSAQARAKVSEALFDQSVPNVNKLKINLMERLGAEFGVKLEDFETASAFGSAVQRIIGEMKMQAGGALRLIEIERKLGLDKLGITLDQLVNAIVDPTSTDGEKLDKALGEQLSTMTTDDKAEASLAKLMQPDDLGLYGR